MTEYNHVLIFGVIALLIGIVIPSEFVAFVYTHPTNFFKLTAGDIRVSLVFMTLLIALLTPITSKVEQRTKQNVQE
jgi:hypothetical protein